MLHVHTHITDTHAHITHAHITHVHITPPPSTHTHTQAGGIAGTTVDVILFPLDTIMTRLQSSKGFWAVGGFNKIYAGIAPAAAGSAPTGMFHPCVSV